MKKNFTTILYCIVSILTLQILQLSAQAQIISTVAGGGINSGVPATQVAVGLPTGVTCDATGNIFIVCDRDGSVRKVNTSGIITTIAGGGYGILKDSGSATAGPLTNPSSVAEDVSGNLYITEENNKIRKVNTAGIIFTIAGTGVGGYSGDGGVATSAQLNYPYGLVIDANGNILFTDYFNNRIRKISPSGIITTIAGNGTGGYNGDGIAATTAELNGPLGITVDSLGNVFVADNVNNRIRKISTAGIITTIAGTGVEGYSGDGGAATSAQLFAPFDVKIDSSGNILIADATNQRVRKISTSGIITTIAGTGVKGFAGDGGTAVRAELNLPSAITIDPLGNILVSDYENNRVREINTSGIINTIAGNGLSAANGDGGLATNAILYNPEAVFVDRIGNIYFPDNNSVRKVDTTGIITTIVGTGVAGFSGDGGLATKAQINGPFGVYVDLSGNIYIGSSFDFRIRKVNATGIISTLAGNGTQGYTGDGGLATNASIAGLQGITGDATGNIYFTDFNSGVVRKINTSGIISTVAGTGTPGYSGDGGPATSAQLYSPNGISMDAAGNIYVGDDYPYNVVRKINTSGIISTVAGGSSSPNGSASSGDGGLATSASFGDIEDVLSDAVGNLYIVDGQHDNVRRVDVTTGIITNFAGNGTAGFSGDGGPATVAEFKGSWAIAQDTAGNFYVGDQGNQRIRKVSIDYTPATTNTSVIQYMNIPFSTNVNDDNFHRLVTITPTLGANLLSGYTTFQVTIDGSLQTYDGIPYVQRHYDITPAANASTSEATIKLYFLQSDFDAYNSYVTGHGSGLPLLPTGGIDNGNTKVTQFHGTGTAPGNYIGSSVLISPSVAWNATSNSWELTFPVTGFSGFYISTANSALPLTLLSFNATSKNNNVILDWQTSNEDNTSHFDIERSADGINFSSIRNMNAAGNRTFTKNYTYTDNNPINGTNFYRLKMVDVDGDFTYSNIVTVNNDVTQNTFKIFPNPATNILYIQTSGENENAVIQIVDLLGRKIQEQKIVLAGNTSLSLDISNLPKSIYTIILKTETKTERQKFVKE